MSNEHPKFGHQIFLDRTHGKRMSAMLARAGFTVHHIFDVYPDGKHERVSDPEWIRRCGEEGWVAISGDKRLGTVPENRQAVIDARAKMFILTDSSSAPEIWAAAVIVGHYKMAEIIEGNDGPFYVSVGKRADGHVSKPKLPEGFEISGSDDFSDEGLPIELPSDFQLMPPK